MKPTPKPENDPLDEADFDERQVASTARADITVFDVVAALRAPTPETPAFLAEAMRCPNELAAQLAATAIMAWGALRRAPSLDTVRRMIDLR